MSDQPETQTWDRSMSQDYLERRNGAEAPPAEESELAAMVLAALDALTTTMAEGFATILARQRVQADQLTEFAGMLAKYEPLLEAAQKRLGGQSWRSRFNTAPAGSNG